MARCLLRFGRTLELSKRTGLWIEAVTVRGGGQNIQKLYLGDGTIAYRDPRTGAIERTLEPWAMDYHRRQYLKELQKRKAARVCP